MEKRYTCSKDALRQTRITFWVYAGSIPVIIILYLIPYLGGNGVVFSVFSLIYVAVLLYLLFGAYRSMRVMLSAKNSFCTIEGDRVSGVSTPDPYKASISFDISKSDIRGIGKTEISVGGMRTLPALVLNTDQKKIVLFAIDRADELRRDLEN